MAYDYDSLYRSTPDALGPADPTLIAMLTDRLAAPGHVLDIGCGQGRDALVLARLGYSVTGVDMSPAGIDTLNRAAQEAGLPVAGIVADVTTYRPDRPVDAVLFDRTLHMLETAARHTALAALADSVKPHGWCLISDEPANMAGLRAVLEDAPGGWQIVTASRSRLLARRGAG